MSVRIDLAQKVKAMMNENMCSEQDMWHTQSEYLFVPVFIYGNEMKGYSEHFRISMFTRFAVGTTVNNSFIMCKSKYHTPIVFNRLNAPNKSRIWGEIYLVDPEGLYLLDSAYERGVFSKRYRQMIEHYNVDDTVTKLYTSDCYMYLHDFNLFKPSIEAGDTPVMKPVMQQKTQKGMYCWTLADDAPNKARQQQLWVKSKEEE
jgi:gamma-glutamylcyclotransferase (GGCT)/AIG2-like uncharacterized protein YtfP